MSIISDFKANFATTADATTFMISEYQKPDSDVFIEFYAVTEISVNQTNTVSVKPLERSHFTVDNKQIKPYNLIIRGFFLPDEINGLTITTYQDLSDYVSDVIKEVNNYTNGPQLFTLSNLFSYGVYEPLTLFGMNALSASESPLPEVVLTFGQTQSTNAIKYSTVQITGDVSEPQNQVRTG